MDAITFVLTGSQTFYCQLIGKLDDLIFITNTLKKKKNVYLKIVSKAEAEITFLRATFNNMWTQKLKARPTNAFFATVNKMVGGSSQLPTTAEHCSVVCTVLKI